MIDTGQLQANTHGAYWENNSDDQVITKLEMPKDHDLLACKLIQQTNYTVLDGFRMKNALSIIFLINFMYWCCVLMYNITSMNFILKIYLRYCQILLFCT